MLEGAARRQTRHVTISMVMRGFGTQTGNMLSVMKEERESSTGMEFREQFDIGEEKMYLRASKMSSG